PDTLPPGIDYRLRPWYVMAIASDDVIYTHAFLNSTEDKLIVTMAFALYEDETLLGVIGADIDISILTAHISSTPISGTGFAVLLDQAGHLLAHPDYNPDILSLISYDTLSEDLIDAIESDGINRIQLSGQDGMVFGNLILDNNYYLAVFIPYIEFMKDTNFQYYLFVSMLLILGSIAAVALIFYNQRIIKPINILDDDIKKIDLIQQVQYRLPTNTQLGFTNVRKTINFVMNTNETYFRTIRRQMIDLEFIAHHDQLTKLKNRFLYETDIKSFDDEAFYPMAMVMADIDGLKLINDSFGHLAGDEIIIRASNIIKEAFMGYDVYRIGGDEFVVLIPNTSIESVEQMKQKALISSEKLIYKNVYISLSFGYEIKTSKNQSLMDIQKNAENYMYRSKLISRKTSRSKSIDTLMQTLYAKSKREKGHSLAVSKMCKTFAEELNMTPDRINELETAGLLHDIGKIAIEAKILNKPGRLDDDEWLEIKRHPEVGYNILNTVDELKQIALWVLYHHERIDGTGYPMHIKGEEIPMESRIISIVNAFDAMTMDKTYRKKLTNDEAVAELIAMKGTQFDADLVDFFIHQVIK
ncbi:MAG: diguanylate cyclase, partial [Acholeplasmataceae bacterium]|nr:diguanylate cyclase [Acholeplasmataceae bacterium]